MNVTPGDFAAASLIEAVVVLFGLYKSITPCFPFSLAYAANFLS